MNPKVTVYLATSLDGFIAREGGEIDWLDAVDPIIPKGEDLGYGELMKSVDVLVMGRNSYEKVLSFGIEWPYGATPVIVLSSKPIEFPEDIPDTVSHSSESPVALCKRLSEEGVQHIYIDGGVTVQRFLQAGMVDEMIITTIPVLIGTGIPLFGPLEKDIHLTCDSAKCYDFGLLQTKFLVNHQASDGPKSNQGDE